MKRIDAIIPTDKRGSVVDAIIQAGAGGVTVSETKGRGSGARPTVRGSRGTATYTAEYNKVDTLTAIVDDAKVEAVVSAIINAAHTGTKGDGKIFVSSVEEAYDIATKQKEQV